MGSVYHLFIVRGYREAFYQLSTPERDRFWEKIMENSKAAGARSLLGCYSRWSNELYPAWGVDEFPDMQAVQQCTRANEKIQHFRYIEAETYHGLLAEGFQVAQPGFPDPIYQLFLVKNQNNDPWTGLAEDTRDRIFAAVSSSIKKNGGVPMLGCDINWSNEEYAFFGVTAWPNIAAEQAHFKDLAGLDWHRYFYARTILGTPYADEI